MHLTGHHKHLKHGLHKKITARPFIIIALLQALSGGVFWSVFPLVLENILDKAALVGLYYSGIAVITLCASLLSTYLFHRSSKVKVFKITLLISVVALIIMTLTQNVIPFGGADIVRAICISLGTIAISLFINEYTEGNNLSTQEGKRFVAANIGWMAGPLIGGYAASTLGHESIFIITAILLSLSYIVFRKIPLHKHIPKHTRENPLREIVKNLKAFFNKQSLRNAFLVSTGNHAWWAIFYLYVPISVIYLGFDERAVGWVMTLSFAPLLIFEYIAGKLAQKNGVRRYIIIGYVLLVSFSVLAFTQFSVPLVFFAILAASGIGMSFIEPLQETNFLQQTSKPESEKFYGIQNMSGSLADIIAPLGASVILTIAHGEIAYVWIYAAGLMGLFLLISLNIPRRPLASL